MTSLRFPDGFTWGVSTAAYQIEGGVGEDGRGESIWDRFSHTPGRILNGDTGDVAADHYHRWREDVGLMAELGIRAYRFSLAWPRLFPSGREPLNPEGLAFYDRLVDALLEHGIAPVPTLYHWDLPQALEDEGGWLARSTADRFADYAAACFDRLGDRVSTWFTVNEPWVVGVLGYDEGRHAPGRRDLRAGRIALHHALLAHGQAVRAFRAGGDTGRIGIVLNLSPVDAATESEADRDAARAADGYLNRWFLDAVLRGSYPRDVRDAFERLTGPFEFIRPDDAAIIGSPTDLLGVNYYTRWVVHADASRPVGWVQDPAPPGARLTEGGWEVTPDRLTDLLVRIRRDYGEVPLVIAENGGIYYQGPGPDGRVHDPERTRYLRDHLAAAHRAIEAGVSLEGYYHWSLLDNFEWAEGYRERFGLIHVDFETGRRTIKDSGRYYAGVIAANAVDPDAEPEA